MFQLEHFPFSHSDVNYCYVVTVNNIHSRHYKLLDAVKASVHPTSIKLVSSGQGASRSTIKPHAERGGVR